MSFLLNYTEYRLHVHRELFMSVGWSQCWFHPDKPESRACQMKLTLLHTTSHRPGYPGRLLTVKIHLNIIGF